MPLDPSISLQVRQFEPPNMLAQYAQVMGIQNAQSQNRLAQVQYENAIREQQNDIATQDAFKGNDRAAAINALYQRGLYKPALVLEKAEQERKKTAGEIEKNEVDTAAKRLDALSSMIAPLANDPNLTHQKVMATGQTLAQMGILKPGWEAQVPQNAMELPAFVRQVALATERGRQSLQMLLPKAEKVDTGAAIGFINSNPLAGQVGASIAGAPVIRKEQSPESRASTGLGYSQLAETKAEHGRVAERARETTNAGKWANDLERGLQVNATTGETRPIMSNGAPLGNKGKPLTDSQATAAGYFGRMVNSHKILSDLEDKGVTNTGIMRSVASGVAGAIPLIGDSLERGVGAGMNVLPGVVGGPNEAQQKTDQARRDFVNAVLRRESGAVISPSEFDSANKQYFPQPGDTKGVIEQKRKNRQQSIASLKLASGPGAERIPTTGSSGGWSIEKVK